MLACTPAALLHFTGQEFPGLRRELCLRWGWRGRREADCRRSTVVERECEAVIWECACGMLTVDMREGRTKHSAERINRM